MLVYSLGTLAPSYGVFQTFHQDTCSKLHIALRYREERIRASEYALSLSLLLIGAVIATVGVCLLLFT